MPELILNGETRCYDDQTFPPTVAALLKQLQFEEARVVAEIDGVVVSRESFGTFALRSGQTVELIRFVGGG